jgi:hypothetical protein
MIEIPFDDVESVISLMIRAGGIAYERWGNLCKFVVILPAEGEKIARVELTGLTISYRWDIASGNVSAFYQRMKILAQSSWGPNCKYDVLLREDGYADIIRKG